MSARDAIERWSEHARACEECGSKDRGTCPEGRPLLAAAARADDAAEAASAKLADALAPAGPWGADDETDDGTDGDETELPDGDAPAAELLGRLQALSLADAGKGRYAVTIQVEVEHANDAPSCQAARDALTRLALDLVRFYRLPLGMVVQP